MKDFFWGLRGSITITDDISDEALLSRVEGMLVRQRKPVVRTGARELAFDTPLWSDWHFLPGSIMITYDRGWFSIDESSHERVLRYKLRSFHAFIFLVLFLLFGVLFFLGSGETADTAIKGAFAFGLLFTFGNSVTGLRTRAMIKRAVLES